MLNTSRLITAAEVAQNIETRLSELTGQTPEWLDASTMEEAYPRRELFTEGWRVAVRFSDGVVRRFDTIMTLGLPSVPVRTALVDHPPSMTWPHVESDGVLCLLSNIAECDPDDPAEVAENLFGRSVQLVEELLEGKIVERDFREEFLTYWAYQHHEDGANLLSLVNPEPPSRVVRIWQGEGLYVVGETAPALRQWLRSRFGVHIDTRTRAGVFIWLDTPLLPAEYPETTADLRELAVAAGPNACDALGEASATSPNSLVTIIGADGRNGPGLIAVRAIRPLRLGTPWRSATDPLTRGFRPGSMHKSVALNRYFGTRKVIRSSLKRADANWIHGRSRDCRTPRLLDSDVVVIGCGSIGAPVACLLARSRRRRQVGSSRLRRVELAERRPTSPWRYCGWTQ